MAGRGGICTELLLELCHLGLQALDASLCLPLQLLVLPDHLCGENRAEPGCQSQVPGCVTYTPGAQATKGLARGHPGSLWHTIPSSQGL